MLKPDSETKPPDEVLFVGTEKLASRVGASLLKASGLNEMICETMADYEDLMVRCAKDVDWYHTIRTRLQESRFTSPLFDTKRWVKNLELAFRQIALGKPTTADILVLDPGE